MYIITHLWQPSYLIALILFYLALVHILRYERINRLPHRYGIRDREDLAALTTDQAQEIMYQMVGLEFPRLMGLSIVFALFKTYGISSISSLLIKTGELASTHTASKRIADTGVLILEFCLNSPSSPRATEAITRMNYLHSHYIKAGKISNDDMLYTLSVFALEPTRWIRDFEWRQMTDLELCACGTFWKSMGDKMQIDMSPLQVSADGWKDGLEWFRAVETWSQAYEERNMEPAEVNHHLVLGHLDVIFLNVPPRFQILGQHLVSIIAGPRLRKAMLLDEPPRWLQAILLGFLSARKYMIRHLFLPRFFGKTFIPREAEPSGRFSAKEYLSHPWYVKPTFARRWGPRALMTRLLGRKLPGDDGNRYNPEGYIIREIGPPAMAGKGTRYMEEDLRRLTELRPGACPFHFKNSK